MITGTVDILVGERTYTAKVDMRTLARLEEVQLSLIKTCRLLSQVRESGDYESFPFSRASMTIGAVLRSDGHAVTDSEIFEAMMGETGVVNAIKAINDMASIAFPERPAAKKDQP